MPRGCQRPGLRFAVSNHDTYDQAGVVESRSERMRDAVAQLAALMDRPGNLRRTMTAKLAWKRKSAEELEHTGFVLALLRIDLRIGPFEVAVRDHCRRAMARTGDVDHVQVVLPNDTIQVDPGECLAGVGAPVPQRSILDVLRAERLLEERVVAKVDHPCTEVVTSAPVRVDLAKLFRGKSLRR